MNDPEKPTPSVDAEHIATAVGWATNWTGTDIEKLVSAMQSIADDVNRARYDGPGFSVEKVMEALLIPLRDIAFHLEQMYLDEDGGSRIVETMQLDQPIVLGKRAIVAWAVTDNGDTWPIVANDTDLRPVIVRQWPLPPAGAYS